MDQRQTFSNLNELKAILEHDDTQQKMAHLIIDRDGLARVNGHISSVETLIDDRDFIRIDNSVFPFIYLAEIVAVNGVFRSDYSEC